MRASAGRDAAADAEDGPGDVGPRPERHLERWGAAFDRENHLGPTPGYEAEGVGGKYVPRVLWSSAQKTIFASLERSR